MPTDQHNAAAASLPIASAVFALLVLANYFPVLSGKVPFPRELVLRHAAWNQIDKSDLRTQTAEIGDLITSFYPFHALVSRAAGKHKLALWNPYLLAGAPLEANSQSALFYPSNLLYYFLPMGLAWTLCLAIRMFLAAIFMALLVRSIGGSTAGAILAGIIFSSCGFMTAWQGQAIVDAAIWLPMICYSIHRLHHERSHRAAALAVFSFAMPILAGHPETAFHLTVTGLALAFLFWVAPERLDVRRFDSGFFVWFAFIGLLAMALASVQMIPTLEWLKQIGPALDVPWPALSRHDGQGFLSRDIMGSPNSAGLPIPEAAAYIGMLTLLAAPLALLHKSRRHVLFLGILTMVAAAIAFSVQPVHWIVDHLPIVKSMKNGRLILLSSFGIAGLAGLGISALEEHDLNASSRKRKPALILIGFTFVVGLFAVYEVHLATLSPVHFTRGPAAALAFLVASAALLAWRIVGRLPAQSFAILACGLAAVEFVSFSYGYMGFARPGEVFPSAPVFDFLHGRGDPGNFRIVKAGFPIPANSGMIYELQSADGYEVVLEAARNFTAGLRDDRDDGVFFIADKLAGTADRRLDMLNVKYVMVLAPSPEFDQFKTRSDRFNEVYRDQSVAVFENKFGLPRLIAIPQTALEIIPDSAEQLKRLKDSAFNPQQSVIFSQTPAGLRPQPDVVRFASDIHLIESNINEYKFRVQTSEPSVLVLSQIFYPGWTATIDGTEVPVHRVNYALSGIIAPAGTHEVHFLFRPLSFKIGAWLSVGAVFILAGLYFRSGKW